MAGEALRIAQRRGCNAGTQPRPQLLQGLTVGAEGGDDGDIVIRIACHRAGNPGGGQMALRVPPAKLRPGNVTTGTPIHSASHVVSPPP